jgi:hypothetical protein
MAKLHANHRKHVQRLKAQARQQRILAAKKTGTPEIPTKILKQLAELNLPPNPWVYSVCLDALLRGT